MSQKKSDQFLNPGLPEQVKQSIKILKGYLQDVDEDSKVPPDFCRTAIEIPLPLFLRLMEFIDADTPPFSELVALSLSHYIDDIESIPF